MINRLMPFVFILVAIGIFFLYINPTYTQDIVQSQQRIASYDRALAAAQDYTSRESDLITQKNQIPSQNIDRLQTFLPDNVDNVQLVLDLSNLAARTGVSLSGFSISSSASNASGVNATPADSADANQGLTSTISSTNLTDSLDVTVNVAGSYANFYNFLQQTEKSLRLLDVTSLSVAANQNSTYTYGVTFRLYWLH